MARIGSLEVRTIGTGRNRVKVVKLPGHKFPIEHFLPENHEHFKVVRRVVWIKSKVGEKPTFIKKRLKSPSYMQTLTPSSELRLARYINSLKIPGVRVEEPLAAILHNTGGQSIIYREVKGNIKRGEKARDLEEKLQKHGVTPVDLQWFAHKHGVTIFDLEGFKVTPVLKRKLGLKYKRPTGKKEDLT